MELIAEIMRSFFSPIIFSASLILPSSSAPIASTVLENSSERPSSIFLFKRIWFSRVDVRFWISSTNEFPFSSRTVLFSKIFESISDFVPLTSSESWLNFSCTTCLAFAIFSSIFSCKALFFSSRSSR